MISQGAEYALKAVICLAQRPGAAFTTQHIAKAAQVPASYLAKLMQALVKARIVTSQRGLNGGFALAVDPQRLTLLEVVRVIDRSRRANQCPLGIESGAGLCPLHRLLVAVGTRAAELLAATTVAQLLAEAAHAPPCAGAGEEVSR